MRRSSSGREAEEEAHQDAIDADRFAGAGGAADEQVRHGGEIGDERLAVDVLAERDGNFRVGVAPVAAFEQFAQEDGDLVRVGDLDADGVLAGDGREDVDALGAQDAGEIAARGC